MNAANECAKLFFFNLKKKLAGEAQHAYVQKLTGGYYYCNNNGHNFTRNVLQIFASTKCK